MAHLVAGHAGADGLSADHLADQVDRRLSVDLRGDGGCRDDEYDDMAISGPFGDPLFESDPKWADGVRQAVQARALVVGGAPSPSSPEGGGSTHGVAFVDRTTRPSEIAHFRRDPADGEGLQDSDTTFMGTLQAAKVRHQGLTVGDDDNWDDEESDLNSEEEGAWPAKGGSGPCCAVA